MERIHTSYTIILKLLGGCEIQLGDVRGSDIWESDVQGNDVLGKDAELNKLSSKAQAVLVYLAMNANQQKRTHLASLLWSNLNESQALANLRKTIHEIKSAFTAADSIIDADRHTLRLSADVNFQVDALRFDAKLQENELSASELEAVVNDYRGEFLGGFYIRTAQEFEVWRETMSQHLHNSYIHAIKNLSLKHEDEGDSLGAISAMEKLLQLEPLREDGHLRLMKLYWRNGQRIDAIKQFETCEQLLRSELGTKPQSELITLYSALQNNELASTPTVFTRPRVQKNHKFIVGPPVGLPELFFGRTAYLSRIFGWWQRPPFGHIAIIGNRRSGKTSLLQHLKPISGNWEGICRSNQKTHWLEDAEMYRWIYIDFQDPRMRSLPLLLSYLLNNFGITPPAHCTLELFMDLATKNPWTIPTLIIMDELEAGLSCDELDQSFWWAMRALTQMTDGLIGIVVASHEQPMKAADSLDKSSPFFNIFVTLDLNPFEESEALEFIDSIDQHYSTDDRHWILEQSGRWPCLLQLLCQEKYLFDQNEIGAEKWRENASHLLHRYDYLLQ